MLLSREMHACVLRVIKAVSSLKQKSLARDMILRRTGLQWGIRACGKAFARLALVAALLASNPLSSLAAVPADPPGKAEAERALRASTRSLGLQTELPSERKARMEPRNLPKERPVDLSGNVAWLMLWGAVVLALGVMFMSVKDSVWSNSRSRRLAPEEKEETAPAATAARMDKAQVEAEELARRGSFAEAMHVLLLQSVSELRRRLGIPIAASLTSREILYRVGLVPEARAVFADIINRVEISYFGAHEPEQEDYFACRRSFEALTHLLRQGVLQRGGP